MLEDLFELYDCLNKKDDEIVKVLKILGASDFPYYLGEECVTVEKVIVKALGGTEGNWAYLLDNGVFYQYRENELSKPELVAKIKHVIEENKTGGYVK